LTRILGALAVLALLTSAAFGLGLRWLRAVPELRAFAPPAKTHFEPTAAPGTSPNSAVVPEPDTFHAMHVDLRNGDELWLVAGPVLEFDWVAEPALYVPEGPSFDNEGNLYFSPIAPREDVSLVSLDRLTGRRRWSVPGGGAGCGAPLILNDPERTGRQLIHYATYTTAMTLRPDGSTVWSAPTGLALPERRPGERDQTHVWGMSYVPPADALIGVTMDGFVFAHDRSTGTPLLAAPFHLPGAKAAVTRTVPAFLARRANAETDAAFGPTPDGLGIFTTILDVVFGNGVNVANFYAVDAGTGRIFIAATAPDEQDGAKDGTSANGAIYALDLRGDRPGAMQLEVVASYAFEGPTGSTPTLSVDGAALLVSDDNGHVIKLDRELRELWRIDVGAQVAASIAVASGGGELYAVTRHDVIRLQDRGEAAQIVWRAQLDAYPGFDNYNALTPTLTANGVAISIGAGRRVGSQQLLTKFGVGLLDRETGRLRSFAEGREESIAVTAVGPDGGIYTAGSPVRRALARALLGDRLPPLVGGITRYRPARLDLLVRDAACAAAGSSDLRRSAVLLRQMQGALREAPELAELAAPLATAGASLAAGDVTSAARKLAAVCRSFE
jgi:outer membrane protein assembly factor BamB